MFLRKPWPAIKDSIVLSSCLLLLTISSPFLGNETSAQLQNDPHGGSQRPRSEEREKTEIVVKLMPHALGGVQNSIPSSRSINPLSNQLRRVLPELGSVRGVKKLFPSSHNLRTSTLNTISSDLDRTFLITVSDDNQDLIAQLNANPNVAYAQPNYQVKTSAAPPIDFYANNNGSWRTGAWGQGFPNLWGLKNILGPEAWQDPDCGTDGCQGQGIIVAVNDTGIDLEHPDLVANAWENPGEIPNNGIDDDENGFVDDIHGWNFNAGNNNIRDHNLHGTHVAGTIGAVANNGIGIAGVAPKASIMAIAGLSAEGSGTSSDLAEGIRYAADNGAHVVNNSWGCNSKCPSNPVVEDAVRYAHSRGVVVVFAAGNSIADAIDFSPNHLSQVISVSAVDRNDRQSYFSNYGEVVDLSAPGGGDDTPNLPSRAASVLSLLSQDAPPDSPHQVGSEYLRLAGTSMAAPHVSGVAALVLQRFPDYSPDEVLSLMKLSSDPHSGSRYLGAGRVNAEAAVQYPERPPVATIHSARIIDDHLTVVGSAGINSFSSWTLEIADQLPEEGPLVWQEVTTSTVSVENDLLVNDFPLQQNSLGQKIVRLSVRVQNGQTLRAHHRFIYDPMGIESPLLGGVYQFGETIPFSGFIDSSFVSLTAQYSHASAPNEWFDHGLKVLVPPDQDQYAGVLVEWDTSAIPSPSTAPYAVRITMKTPRSEISLQSNALFLDYRSAEGWPKEFRRGATTQGILLHDLNDDGEKEIIVSHMPIAPRGVTITAYRLNGEELWSTTLPYGEEGSLNLTTNRPGPFIGDLNGDGVPEIYIITRYQVFRSNPDDPFGVEIHTDYRLFSLTHNGQLSSGSWPIVKEAPCLLVDPDIPDVFCSRILPFEGAMIADIDGDGLDDLFTREFARIDERTSEFSIRRYDFLGAEVSHFLIDTEDITDTFDYQPILAFGNFDEDSELEIVTDVEENALTVYNLDGSSLEGWPASVPGEIATGVATGDVNNDGFDDIVVAYLADEQSPDQLTGGVSVITHSGDFLPGLAEIPVFPSGQRKFNNPALADLTFDGRLEIIYPVGDTLHILNSQGQPLSNWPQKIHPSGFREGVAVGDVNGDGSLDILATGYGQEDPRAPDLGPIGAIYGFSIDGTPIPFNGGGADHRLPLESPNSSAILMDDLDQDGLIELIATDYFSRTSNHPPYHFRSGYEVTLIHLDGHHHPERIAWNSRLGSQHYKLDRFPGDADGDGCAGATDYLIHHQYTDTSYPLAAPHLGDFNYDRTIDAIDLEIWERNAGNCRGGETIEVVLPIPTPTPMPDDPSPPAKEPSPESAETENEKITAFREKVQTIITLLRQLTPRRIVEDTLPDLTEQPRSDVFVSAKGGHKKTKRAMRSLLTEIASLAKDPLVQETVKKSLSETQFTKLLKKANKNSLRALKRGHKKFKRFKRKALKNWKKIAAVL